MTTITITPSKSSNIEFELSVQGLIDDSQISVRFVVLKLFHGCNISIDCSKISGGKWMAALPPNVKLDEKSYLFRIEAVVNEYYFEPASGKLEVISDPVVKMQENVKPSMTATFSVSEAAADVVDQIDEDLSLLSNDDTFDVVEESVVDNTDMPIIPTAPPTVRKLGKLFERDSSGKPALSGIDSLEVAKRKVHNAKKVQDILSPK